MSILAICSICIFLTCLLTSTYAFTTRSKHFSVYIQPGKLKMSSLPVIQDNIDTVSLLLSSFSPPSLHHLPHISSTSLPISYLNPKHWYPQFHASSSPYPYSSSSSFSSSFSSLTPSTSPSLTQLSSISSTPSSSSLETRNANTMIACIAQFDAYKYALSGGFAGGCRALSRAITFPFDTLKTVAQSDARLRPSRIDNYYRGVWISIIAAIPANALFFVIYYSLDHAWQCTMPVLLLSPSSSTTLTPTPTPTLSLLPLTQPQYEQLLFFMRLLFSAIATVPQNLVKVPAELLKQRAQLAMKSSTSISTSSTSSTGSTSISQIAQNIIAKEGFGGLFRGASAQLLRELPYNALQMVIFAFGKAHYHEFVQYVAPLWLSLNVQSSSSSSDVWWEDDQRLVSGLLGLVACALAALLTQPADVLKTRLMTDPDDVRRLLHTVRNGDSDNHANVVTDSGNYSDNSDNNKNNDKNNTVDSDNIDCNKSSNNNNIKNDHGEDGNSNNQNAIWQAAKEVYAERGWRGFFAGLSARLAIVSIGGMIYFAAASLITDDL